ncbi:hypothetical protein [Candidatus Neomicrothrix sp.]|uniref:hypothetical protein n=1 Tax=Candidatus Neomicrothrix sp. TaxID=2719034 RepID=UPI002CA49700|nr:hypothetical protein [Candidatus Microthrix sp.]HMS49317.1 hypothetical protein [Candidatus Microthrix sp.]
MANFGGFTSRRVAELEGLIRVFARRRLTDLGERAAEGDPVDLHQEFASTIPTYVLADLFGVAEVDRLRFGPWVQALTAIQNDWDIPRHLAFSSGPHSFIGNHLARLQAKVAFEELLKMNLDVSVDVDAGVRHRSPFVRGFVSLPAHRFSTSSI